MISTVDLEPGSLVRKARAAPKLGELDLVRGVTAERIAPLCLPADSYDALAGQRAAGARTVRAPDRGVGATATRIAVPRGGAGAGWRLYGHGHGRRGPARRRRASRGGDRCRRQAQHHAPSWRRAAAGSPWRRPPPPRADISALEPDGLFLVQRPRRPRAGALPGRHRARAADGHRDLPVFGICLGLQIMSLALDANIYKLKFGHHGANHPVREERTGVISITSQNHGYAVDADSLPPDLSITHVNLNDGTVEGLEHRSRPVFAIQYHPEAAPGPHDAQYLFDRFVDAMEDSTSHPHKDSGL